MKKKQDHPSGYAFEQLPPEIQESLLTAGVSSETLRDLRDAAERSVYETDPGLCRLWR